MWALLVGLVLAFVLAVVAEAERLYRTIQRHLCRCIARLPRPRHGNG